MDRRFLRSLRKRSGERGSDFAGVGIGRKRAPGSSDFATEAYYHPREQTKSPKVDLSSTSGYDSTTEEDLFFYELHGRLCKKVDGTPMNKITDELVSRIVEKRRSSSSVIARLMGLDELPPQHVVSKLKNETGHFFLKKSYAGLGEKHECSGNQSFHASRRRHQNFKIVHDHFVSSEVHIDKLVQKEKQNSKPGVACIMKQFIEAKRLSIKEAHKKYKQLSDALDTMDANEDIFCKHFQDIKHSKSTSHTDYFKILESSAGKRKTFYRSVETKEHRQKKKDITHCRAKPCTRRYSHFTYDHEDSLLPKLLRSHYTGKTETSLHQSPTSIVVLKPRDQKAQITGRTELFPRYIQNYKLGCRRHRDLHGELLVERGEEHQLFDVKTKRCNTKATNDFPSDISNQVKQSLRSFSEELLAKTDKYSSSTYLGKSSLSRNSMKSLPERWKTTRSSRRRMVGEGSSTLGDMLSLSDKVSSRSLGQLILKSKSDNKVDKADMHRSCSNPSGMSSNEGWNDACDELLPRSEDNLHSSAFYVSSKLENRQQVGCINSIEDCYMLKDLLNLEQNDLHSLIIERGHSLPRNLTYRDNKLRSFRSCGEENKKPAREVELCQDESKNMININKLIEPKPIYLQRNIDDLLNLVCHSSNLQNLDSDKSFLTDPKEFHQLEKDNDLPVILLENDVQEVASVHFPLLKSPLDVVRESGACILPRVTERLSPVSVLETRSEDGKSTPPCLERISAGLLDIQKQLNLLKLETVHSSDGQSKSLFNDKATEEILKSLQNGSERDFLYLLDILTVSGIYAASQNNFFDPCYSLDNPVFPDVFDKLENEYNMVNSWSRSDRKLLFDHINSILAEVLAPCIDLHPWVKLKTINFCGHSRLVYWSWHLLVWQQKMLSRGKPEEKVLDTRWLYIDDHVDMIGREIERMLKDDLLNELVSEFI